MISQPISLICILQYKGLFLSSSLIPAAGFARSNGGVLDNWQFNCSVINYWWWLLYSSCSISNVQFNNFEAWQPTWRKQVYHPLTADVQSRINGWFPLRKIILRTGSDRIESYVYSFSTRTNVVGHKRNFPARYDPKDSFPGDLPLEAVRINYRRNSKFNIPG